MSVVTFIGNKCAVYALVRAAARVSHTANYDEKLGRGPCCPSRVTAATHNLVEEPVDIYIIYAVDGCRRCSFLTSTELLTFRFHSVNAARRPHLSATLKDSSPATPPTTVTVVPDQRAC